MTAAMTPTPVTEDVNPIQPPAEAPEAEASSDLPSKDAGTWKEIVRIGLPMALSSGTMAFMHAVDRMMLAWDSPAALAAALPAGGLHWLVMSFFLGMISYVNTFIAQYEGAKDHRGAASSLWQALHLSLVAGAGLLVFVPLAPTIFAWAKHAPEVQSLEVAYFQPLVWGSAGALGSSALSCFFSGRGRTGVVLGVNIFSNLVNLVLDYLFIFGWGSIPRMGAFGAGLATAISQYAGLAMFIAILVLGRDGRTYPLASTWRPDFPLMGRMIRFGLPAGVHYAMDGAAFNVFILLVGRLGTMELAITNLVFNLNFLAYGPILGLGTAVSTIVGQRIGEKRPELAVASVWKGFALAAGYTILCMGVFLVWPQLLLKMFDHQDATAAELARIQSLATMLLQFVAVYALFDATAVIFGSACRGAGDVWVLLVLNVAAGWLLMVLPTYAAQRYDALTLGVAFTFITLFILVLGLGSLARFLSGRWKSMSVID